MALYEYQCLSCGDLSEVIQRMSDPPLTTCEECGGDLKKLISAPSFKFKGTGWYVTDYADKKGKGDTTSGSKGSDSGDSGDSDTKGSSESKDSGSSSSDSSSSKSESKSSSEPKSKPEKVASKD